MDGSNGLTPAQAEWARCKPWIVEAFADNAFYRIEDIEAAVEAGTMHFWPGKNCCAFTEILTFPKCKAMNVFAVAGMRGRALKELMQGLEPALVKWAKATGCTKIMGYGIHANWRPVCEAAGYEHQWTVMIKDVPA